jgi:hypothetical protein
MLYRHFSGLSNTEYSILTLSLAAVADGTPAGDRLARELLATAVKFGINLFDAGSDPARAKSIRKLANEISAETDSAGGDAAHQAFSLILTADAGTPAELARFLDEAKAEAGDILIIAPDPSLAAEAARARASGRIAAYGFRAERSLEEADIIAAIDAHSGWDFFAAPFNYLVRNLDGAFAHAADREMMVIALDPFAGGRLEAVPPAVHEFFRNAPVPRSHDEWALRAIWERQEIATAVWNPAETQNRNAHGEIAASAAGASPSAAAMTESLIRKSVFAEAGRANSLPSRELAVIRAAADAFAAETKK